MNVLEANVRVDNEERAERGVHDGVKGTGSEWSNGQRYKASCNDSIQTKGISIMFRLPSGDQETRWPTSQKSSDNYPPSDAALE